MSAEDSFYWISIGYLIVLIVSVAAAIRVWRLNDRWERGEENRSTRRYANFALLGLTAAGAAASVVLFFLSQVIQSKSDVKVADANRIANEAGERAAKLELQVAKIRSPRSLTPEQRSELASIGREFAGTKFVVSQNYGDSEAQKFMIDIINPLINSGWLMINLQNPLGYELSNKKRIGVDFYNGLKIEIDKTYMDKLKRPADALVAFLNKLDFDALVTEGSPLTSAGNISDEPDVMHIIVGRKVP